MANIDGVDERNRFLVVSASHPGHMFGETPERSCFVVFTASVFPTRAATEVGTKATSVQRRVGV